MDRHRILAPINPDTSNDDPDDDDGGYTVGERRECGYCNGTGEGFKGDTCGMCHATGYRLRDKNGKFRNPCHVHGHKICNDPRHKA